MRDGYGLAAGIVHTDQNCVLGDWRAKRDSPTTSRWSALLLVGELKSKKKLVVVIERTWLLTKNRLSGLLRGVPLKLQYLLDLLLFFCIDEYFILHSWECSPRYTRIYKLCISNAGGLHMIAILFTFSSTWKQWKILNSLVLAVGWVMYKNWV